MKRMALILAVLLLAVSPMGITASSAESESTGSDMYTAADVLFMLKEIINETASEGMDANLDGKVNLLDVLTVLRSVVGVSLDWDFTVSHSKTVSVSGSNWWNLGVQYPRLLLVSHSSNGENGTLLATFEQLNSGLVSHRARYPIFRSTDDGATWQEYSYVQDNDATLRSEWNPHLFELEKPLGDYAAGTVFLAGCSVDPAHSTSSAIRLYASTDGGKTWGTPISVATGGGLDNGVWEPFLMQLDDGRLVCFYSDDTDANHSQKIVYKVSSDGKTFGGAVEVVASNKLAERPGMPVVTRLGDGSYFMVYEVVDCDGISGNPVFYRTSSDGLNWGSVSSLGTALVSKDGKALGSAPYCVWTPVGGKNGTLVVSGTFMRNGSSTTGTDYFISTDCGNTWKTIDHLVPYDATVDHCGYSNSMVFSADGKAMYAINNPVSKTVANHAEIVFAKGVCKLVK